MSVKGWVPVRMNKQSIIHNMTMCPKKYIDISVPVSPSSVCWPGSHCVEFSKGKDMARGDAMNDTSIHMSIHTGTHIDAPLHFVANGKSVDQLPIEGFIGSALVLDLPEAQVIDAKILNSCNIHAQTDRVLFKTKNTKLLQKSPQVFDPGFVALSVDGAKWLVEKGIKLVGIDYLSIQGFHDGPQVHQILLNAGIIILEGLDLREVHGGEYELICLPIKLAGIEGAPVRAILREK